MRFLGLVLLGPLLLIITILIKLIMSDSVLLSQRRVGRYGDFFVIHKFRIMIGNQNDKTNYYCNVPYE